ncbi:MAG TPA: HlyD family secretion protein, partial [Armatimonadota bacterium]|nr:HlyD family secretion protein [Armatimonadota bacterium]
LAGAQSGVKQAVARRSQARAGVAQAQANLKSANDSIRTAQAKVDQAQAGVREATNNVSALKAGISQQQAKEAQAVATLHGTQSAPAQVNVSRAQAAQAAARVQQARARVAELELQRSYTRIVAPHDGVVSRKNVSEGATVQIGQPLMAIADLKHTYVTANFKETQLKGMRIGSEAEVKVDAYPGRVFHGHVESFSPGTGAVFSLLPPENATGNFTKVVQRVPVRIVIDAGIDPRHPLRLGMSVEATVTTHS